MDNLTEQYFKLILALLVEKEKRLKAMYFAAIVEITKAAAGHRSLNQAVKKSIARQIKILNGKIQTEVVNGIDRAWSLSGDKNTVFVDKALEGMKISPKAKKVYYDVHDAVRESFKKERIGGMKLSDRIWKVGDQFRGEMEIGVQQGIATGESANKMARRMQKHLLVPDNKFLDVEDEKLRKELRKKALKNHAGQGVYRSSYKNALRMTREEINRSYRTADYERWQTQSFVVGIKISLSNNHKHLPGGIPEVCEVLAGNYPKDYVFKGNHIQCMCHATPILITKEEREERRTTIINGEEWKGKSKNEIDDVPKAYKDWIRKYANKLNSMKTLPDIVSANKKYLPKNLIKNV